MRDMIIQGDFEDPEWLSTGMNFCNWSNLLLISSRFS